MSYAYLRARNFRWWTGAAFSIFLAAMVAAGALISSSWTTDGGLRSALAQARFLTSGCGLPWWVPAPCFPDAQLSYSPGERASAGRIAEALENCVSFECFKARRDASALLYFSPVGGVLVASGVLVFAAFRHRKNKNRDEQLRGSQIATSRQLARRVNQLDPD